MRIKTDIGVRDADGLQMDGASLKMRRGLRPNSGVCPGKIEIGMPAAPLSFLNLPFLCCK
jgi:hypothetical protein